MWLTCEEVADKYRIKVQVVWSWIRSKKLRAFQLSEGHKGKYRINSNDLEAFEKAHMTTEG